MLILALDVASKLGWAIHDTDKTPSAILSGSIKLEGSNAFEKTQDMRRKLPKLIRQHQPAFAAMEAPLTFIPQFKKKTRTLMGVEEETSTINANTIMQLNWLAGAAEMVVLGQNVPCTLVSPRTWQSIIPDHIRGAPKQRAKAYCDMLRIDSPNADSRDAAVIALWCAGHCQELKLLQRVRAAA